MRIRIFHPGSTGLKPAKSTHQFRPADLPTAPQAGAASSGDPAERAGDRVEGLGFLVMVNGVVGSNTHRKLDPREFRGFALADRMAPLIFINGADTKAAQIFTLAHELAHLWLGEAALDDVDLTSASEEGTERWCNQVAAEVLVPISAIVAEMTAEDSVTTQIDRLARRFKVSTLVALRRLYDAHRMNWAEYRDAFQMLGFKKLATFNELASRLGIL